MDEFIIRVSGTPHEWHCGEQESVAEGADRAQLGRRLFHGCRGGGCGVCKIRVLEGAYTLRRHSIQANPPEETARGIVLACCAVPSEDLLIDILRPASPL